MSEVAQKAENMVAIEIDGVATEAPKGSMIIEAADKLGINIPRFCYHRKLSIAANCRMCLVDVEKAPKPLPACATPVMDGMKVYTHSKRARESQQNVMELLLINHPLDCPICDQGGECELQDVSMGFGRSVSRYAERKRVIKDENLGSLISTDMTRCIHCTRCVRFLEKVAGTTELGGMGRGEKTFISTFIGRSIDSELSGNIIDLCPVGALTNKPFRFRARAWELRASDSVAPHDCVGSNVHYHTRRGRILRAVPRDNEALNESWLADRDRWGFEGLYADDRMKTPMLRDGTGELIETDWESALQATADILKDAGPQAGYLIGGQSSSEEMYLVQSIARALGSENVDSRLRLRDLSGPTEPQFPLSLDALSESELIVLVGSNVTHEQPLLAHRIRQATLKGAKVVQLGSFEYPTHFEIAQQILVAPSEIPAQLTAKGDIARMLDASAKSVLWLGQTTQTASNYSEIRAAATALAEATESALCIPGIDANAHGAAQSGALPGAGGKDALAMCGSELPAYLVYNFEADKDAANGAQLMASLKQARTIVAAPFASQDVLDVADVVLPVAPCPEAEGSMTAVTGTVQAFGATGNSPGDARMGWKALRVLGNKLELAGFDYTRCDQIRTAIAAGDAMAAVTGTAGAKPDSGLEIVVESAIYNVDGMVRRSAGLQQTNHRRGAEVRVHPEAGISGSVDIGGASFEVIADPRVAPGVAVVSAQTRTADLSCASLEVV